jgi:MFS family permease
MKYLPGNVYDNSTVSSIADIVGTFMSLYFFDRFGIKWAFIGCLAFSILGGFLILLMHDFGFWMPVFVIITKLGTAGTFNLCYISNSDLFPTLFASTAMGICNFFARICTIAAP